MAKLKEKFLVINLKYLEKIPHFSQPLVRALFEEMVQYIPKNKYFVCNQDEPYADEVIRVILEGEEAKEQNAKKKATLSNPASRGNGLPSQRRRQA